MDPQAMEFLGRLAQEGDKVDSHQVGEEMGLDRGQIDTLSVDLMTAGLLEMVSLSGQVRVTEAGKKALGGGLSGRADGDGLEALLDDLADTDLGLAPGAAADLAVDLETIRAQLKRSEPLGPVISACLQAVALALAKSSAPQAGELARRAKGLAG